jgi:ATPase subunit of ABC transporter with duplicated ATPase domains
MQVSRVPCSKKVPNSGPPQQWWMQVCVVGPNGAGKSTLMNLIAGDMEPTEGFARRSNKLRVGRYAQHFVDALSMEDTPVEYLMRTYGHIRKPDDTELKEYDVRAMLGKFGLSGHHHHQARFSPAWPLQLRWQECHPCHC